MSSIRKKTLGLVYGIGINNADYCVSNIRGYRCPFYERWVSMLKRCYSLVWCKKYPTYIGCSVCNEWLTFSNFKSWMEQQDWEGNELDKDLLIRGNKVYSPETCCFIPKEVNVSLQYPNKGQCLLGVTYDSRSKMKPFVAKIQEYSRTRYLGCYSSEKEAHKVWQLEKISALERLSFKFYNFKDLIDTRILLMAVF